MKPMHFGSIFLPMCFDELNSYEQMKDTLAPCDWQSHTKLTYINSTTGKQCSTVYTDLKGHTYDFTLRLKKLETRCTVY